MIAIDTLATLGSFALLGFADDTELILLGILSIAVWMANLWIDVRDI